MQRVLVALDLDGTLLDEWSQIPAGHERVVAELRQQGAEVAIVTGRPVLTARWVYDYLRLTTPMVCFNGGWVGYPAASTPWAACALTEVDVREIVAAVRGDDGAISCYPNGREWIMDRATAITADWSSLYQAPIIIDAPRIHHWQGPSAKVMFVAEAERLSAIAERIRQQYAGRFHVVVSQPDRFEVSPIGITKAWGLERVCAQLGIAQADVWAVGDAANDIEMVRWAGHGCAMGQAPDCLRRHARHVIPSISARGLCALPHLIQQASLIRRETSQ